MDKPQIHACHTCEFFEPIKHDPDPNIGHCLTPSVDVARQFSAAQREMRCPRVNCNYNCYMWKLKVITNESD